MRREEDRADGDGRARNPGRTSRGIAPPQQHPRIRSIAVAFTPQLVDRNEKRLAIARIDSVFHRHQDGPAIVVELMESNRRWPMHRWRQIDFSAGLQFPRPCQRDRSECASGGGRDCLQKVFPKWSIPWET